MDCADSCREQRKIVSRTSTWLQSSLLLLAICMGSVFLVPLPIRAADDISGIWLNDLRDGQIEIKPCGQARCGYVVSILDPTIPPNPHDIYNENPNLRTRPLCGLQILGDLKDDGDAWEGWVYDPHPDRGRTYSVEVKLQDPNTLIVHGYLGVKLLGETRLWIRDNKNFHRCLRPAN